MLRIAFMLLAWMDYNRGIVLATANDRDKVPPELLRPGRLDAIFLFELPTTEECEKILMIHLQRRGQDPVSLEIGRHAQALHGCSGASIEAAVIDALYLATGEGSPLTDRHLAAAIRSVMLNPSRPALQTH